MITRGTTYTDVFNTDISLVTAERINITYSQWGKILFEKQKSDLRIHEGHLELDLTQQETLKFDPKAILKIQIRAKFPNGAAIASPIMEVNVYNILKEGVI